MAYAEWNQALETGIETIDEQHKRLFALIDALHDAALGSSDENDAVVDALYDLTEYVIEHFADEEELMALHAYDGLPVHHELHQHLAQKTFGYMAEYVKGADVPIGELSDFLNDWLRHHILEQDCLFTARLTP